jgi:hypothetical protein
VLGEGLDENGGLRLELRHIRSTVVELRLVNTGGEPVDLLKIFADHYNMINFDIVNEDGTRVKYNGVIPHVILNRDSIVRLYKDQFIGDIRDLAKSGYTFPPGRYKISVTYVVPDYIAKSHPGGVNTLWSGTLKSEVVTMTVPAKP